MQTEGLLFVAARLRRDSPAPCKGKVRFGVTRNPLSYSKDTLLCSGEHKNPSEDGLREEPIRPQHEAAWCALSLGCKCRGFRSRISEAENAKGCHLDATSCHLRRSRYKRYFFLVYLRYEPTSEGMAGGWSVKMFVGTLIPTNE